MSLSETKRNEIMDFIVCEIAELDDGETLKIKPIADWFGITTQSVFRYLVTLDGQGRIIREENGHRHAYSLPTTEATFDVALAALDVNAIWNRKAKSVVEILCDATYSACNLAFTQLLANAAAHSGGRTALVDITANEVAATVTIRDDGIGIFGKIAAERGYVDARVAVRTIENAQNGGLREIRRISDGFAVFSDGVQFGDARGSDALWTHRKTGRGTSVRVTISAKKAV
ncbi:MAG: hypothetical protein LBN00_07330 [Oscillospiraceae bacterium]|jgi:predicted transcriptional regulator|nr:hypothetical protein [Oscillospiraceae bacterium]